MIFSFHFIPYSTFSSRYKESQSIWRTPPIGQSTWQAPRTYPHHFEKLEVGFRSGCFQPVNIVYFGIGVNAFFNNITYNTIRLWVENNNFVRLRFTGCWKSPGFIQVVGEYGSIIDDIFVWIILSTSKKRKNIRNLARFFRFSKWLLFPKSSTKIILWSKCRKELNIFLPIYHDEGRGMLLPKQYLPSSVN